MSTFTLTLIVYGAFSFGAVVGCLAAALARAGSDSRLPRDKDAFGR